VATLAGVARYSDIHLEEGEQRGLPHISQESLPIMKKIAPSVWNLITDQGELLRENR
jgi:hypothetical protein